MVGAGRCMVTAGIARNDESARTRFLGEPGRGAGWRLGPRRETRRQTALSDPMPIFESVKGRCITSSSSEM